MMLAISLSKYNRQYIVLLPPVKNNLVEEGIFIRIMYSPNNVAFNGLFIYILHETTQDICAIERDILKLHKTTKLPIYSVERQVIRTPKSVLKISGIWENETHYGLVYKCID